MGPPDSGDEMPLAVVFFCLRATSSGSSGSLIPCVQLRGIWSVKRYPKPAMHHDRSKKGRSIFSWWYHRHKKANPAFKFQKLYRSTPELGADGQRATTITSCKSVRVSHLSRGANNASNRISNAIPSSDCTLEPVPGPVHDSQLSAQSPIMHKTRSNSNSNRPLTKTPQLHPYHHHVVVR
ncbi:hypothetical protein B0I37DRAFT_372770 [Chaetomium sp. MPI-CAGE-AT-0009]|nr:hypothetical protein B0I37DRAFT_372770 [Chaetomium sp. MPI-CAGE-AT-0009]